MHEALIHELKKHISLSDQEEELIRSSFRSRKVKRNQILVQPPDVALYENYVVSGCLMLYYLNEEGIQHTLMFAPEGWWMTDLESFLGKHESKYFIQAVEDTELLILGKEAFENLLKNIPALNSYFLVLYQKAIIGLNERLLNVLSTKVDERYARFLKKYPQLEGRLPQYLIASYLGVTPEFFSRVKSRFYKHP